MLNYISKTWGKTLVSCVVFNTSMCTIAFKSFTQCNVACITNICTIKSIETSGAFWKTEDNLYNELFLPKKRKRKPQIDPCISSGLKNENECHLTIIHLISIC
jgi:hypothetical protein